MRTSSFTRPWSGAWQTALLALLMATGAAQAAPRYRVLDLGLLEFHSTSNALDMNNRGEIVGWSLDGVPDGERIGFLWRNGVMQAIKSPDYGSSSAEGINEHGQIALTGFEGDGFFPPSAYVYDSRSGRLQRIPTPSGFGTAGAINNAGHVIGIGNVDGPAEHYLFDGNTTSKLPENLSFAFDINDSDAVVGYRNDGRPAIYQDSTVTPLSSQRGQGNALNNRGQAVGQLESTDTEPGGLFLYSDGRLQLLDTGGRGGTATDINEHGSVVGTLEDDSVRLPFVYRDGALQDLNTLLTPDADAAWTLIEANAINDRGWIVGMGKLVRGADNNAFVAIPVPEPGAWALMLVGAVVIGAVVRRRAVQHTLR